MFDAKDLEVWVKNELYEVLGFSKKSIENMIIDILKEAGKKFSSSVDSSVFINSLQDELISIGMKDESALNFSVKTYQKFLNCDFCSTSESLSPSFSKRKISNFATFPDSSSLLDENKKKDSNEETTSNVKKIKHDNEDEEKSKNFLMEAEKKAKLEEIEKVLLVKKGRNEKFKDDKDYMHNLRKEARYEYLRKREEDRLQLAEREYKDKEFFYRDLDISEKEKKSLALQKELIDIAKKTVNERDVKGDVLDAYVMPDSYDEDMEKRLLVMNKKYVEEKKQKSELQLWEEYKTSAAISRFGARKGRDEMEESKKKKYALINEEGASIDFELLEQQAGSDLSHFMNNEEKCKIDPAALSKGNLEQREREKVKIKRNLLLEERKLLPVYAYRKDLLRAIRMHKVLILVGETGSGKTTQVPQYLYEVGYSKAGVIGCTQPRRVAAMSVAARVANEMDVKIGREVGYCIRFEDNTSEKTEIKYMTDGMLLRELLNDPLLEKYSCIIIDEAHERTIQTDILFGLLKDIVRYRGERTGEISETDESSGTAKNDDKCAGDFRLIISSATLEAEKFSSYFDFAPIFKIPGRRFPVDIYYTKAPEANFLDAAVVTVMQIHLTQPLDGDILVFLPGRQEIEDIYEELQLRTRNKGSEVAELIVLPIYSSLPSEMQARIFEKTPPNARKVVLATNIAETSITVDNVVYVIDPGFCKQTSFNPKTGIESLTIVPCSKASSNQRAGRAGRVKAGKCFRLFTKSSFEKELEEAFVPEIQRSNLNTVILTLKSLGIDDILNFDYMDPPPAETLMQSLELLYALGCLNDKGELTKTGRRIAELPLEPMYAKMILYSNEKNLKCVNECVTICSMLSIGNSIFYRPKQKALHADNAKKNFFRQFGDHFTFLNVYNQWEEANYSANWCYENFIQHRSMKQARDIREQIIDLLERIEIEMSSNVSDVDGIRKCITAGFFMNSARINKNGNFTTLKHPHHTVEIHPESTLFKQNPYMLIYTELVLTTKEYMRHVLEIKPEWLFEIAPHFYKNQSVELGAKLPKTIKN